MYLNLNNLNIIWIHICIRILECSANIHRITDIFAIFGAATGLDSAISKSESESQHEQIQMFLHKQNPNGHLYWRCIFDCSLEFLCWISGFRSRVLVLNIWWLSTWAIKVAILKDIWAFLAAKLQPISYYQKIQYKIKKMKNKLDFRNFLTYPLNHES